MKNGNIKRIWNEIEKISEENGINSEENSMKIG